MNSLEKWNTNERIMISILSDCDTLIENSSKSRLRLFQVFVLMIRGREAGEEGRWGKKRGVRLKIGRAM